MNDVKQTALPDDKQAVVLRPAKRKMFRLLVPSLAFTSIGVTMILRGEGIFAWLATALFALGSVVFALQLIPGVSYLRLSRDGFIVCSLFRVSPVFAWNSVSQFRVASLPPAMTKMVVFDQFGAPHPHLKRLNRALVGAEAGLPDTYGLSASELAALMNNWRARYAPAG